jgi:galactonate dehydratase
LARDRVRLYDHLGGGNSEAVYNSETANAFADKMYESVDLGFTAVKILAVPQSAPLDGVDKLKHTDLLMKAAREAAGDQVDIMIDFHGRTSAGMAIQFAKILEPYRPYFLEEVVPPEQFEAMKRVKKKVSIPLAAGERLYSTQDYLPFLQAGILDVAQPDVCHAGGITGLRKIAALCDSFGVVMAPHNPLGPIATMVNVHLGLVTPNFLIQEVMRADVPWRADVVEGSPEIQDGHIHPPTTIGIGATINDAEASKHPYIADAPTQWFHPDGSVADW